MVSSAARTVAAYLAELPPERRAVVARVLALVREHMPPGYEESMAWGMICWSIPLSRYPDTYNGQPLAYVCLAAQKNNYALYLTGPYMLGEEVDRKFRAAFAAAGKKIDMGKSCLRFKRIEDLALEPVAESIASVPVELYLEHYEATRGAAKASGKKPAKGAGGTKALPAKAAPSKRDPKPVAARVPKKPSTKKSATSRQATKPPAPEAAAGGRRTTPTTATDRSGSRRGGGSPTTSRGRGERPSGSTRRGRR